MNNQTVWVHSLSPPGSYFLGVRPSALRPTVNQVRAMTKCRQLLLLPSFNVLIKSPHPCNWWHVLLSCSTIQVHQVIFLMDSQKFQRAYNITTAEPNKYFVMMGRHSMTYKEGGELVKRGKEGKWMNGGWWLGVGKQRARFRHLESAFKTLLLG